MQVKIKAMVFVKVKLFPEESLFPHCNAYNFQFLGSLNCLLDSLVPLRRSEEYSLVCPMKHPMSMEPFNDVKILQIHLHDVKCRPV